MEMFVGSLDEHDGLAEMDSANRRQEIRELTDHQVHHILEGVNISGCYYCDEEIRC